MEVYEHCPLLNANLADIRANINERSWDWLHINSGMEGAGKSSIGLYICKMMDEHFEPKKQTVYSQMQFSSQIDKLDKGQALFVDEGVEWLFNRNWNTPESRVTVADLMLMREFNLFICVNMTDINYLDVYIRESRVRSCCNVITYPRVNADRDIAFRERGLFECYSRATILEHFRDENKFQLIPEFIEPYPEIQSLEGGPEMWKEYHDNKLSFLASRKKIREDSKMDKTKLEQMEKEVYSISAKDLYRTAKRAARIETKIANTELQV